MFKMKESMNIMTESRKDFLKTLASYTIIGGIAALSFYAYWHKPVHNTPHAFTAMMIDDEAMDAILEPDSCIASDDFIETNLIAYPGSTVEVASGQAFKKEFPEQFKDFPDNAKIEVIGVVLKDAGTDMFTVEGVPMKVESERVHMALFVNDCMQKKAINLTTDEWKKIKEESR